LDIPVGFPVTIFPDASEMGVSFTPGEERGGFTGKGPGGLSMVITMGKRTISPYGGCGLDGNRASVTGDGPLTTADTELQYSEDGVRILRAISSAMIC